MGNRLVVEPYYTPAGFVDFPFTYVYDGTGLTDGRTIMNIQKPMQGDCDFVLRSIVGVPTVVDTAVNGGKFNFKNSSGSYALQAPVVMPNVYGVVPEKLYPYDSSIYFDLYNVLRGANDCREDNPIKDAFIAFMGVKRFPLGRGYAVRETPYPYYEKRYSYEYSLTLTQGHYTSVGSLQTTVPQRQVIQMDNYDFELFEIAIQRVGASGALSTTDFQVVLYDSNMHALSDNPLDQGYINAGRPTPATCPPYQAVWPTPSLVYPAGGNIVFDVTSMLCPDNVPVTYNMSFQGVWRKPC